MTKHRLTLYLLAVFALLALMACAPKSEDVPTLRSADDLRAQPTAPAEAMEDETKIMAFTQCLRDHGVDILDPVVDADGNVQKPQLASDAKAMDRQAWKQAFEECGHLIEGVTWAEKRVDRSAQMDYWRQIARCLGEKGYDVAEPTAEEVDTWLSDLKATLDWDNADVAKAWEDCSQSIGGEDGKAK